MLSYVMAWSSLIKNFQVSCLFFSELRKREFIVWKLRDVGNLEMHIQMIVFDKASPWGCTLEIGFFFFMVYLDFCLFVPPPGI